MYGIKTSKLYKTKTCLVYEEVWWEHVLSVNEQHM